MQYQSQPFCHFLTSLGIFFTSDINKAFLVIKMFLFSPTLLSKPSRHGWLWNASTSAVFEILRPAIIAKWELGWHQAFLANTQPSSHTRALSSNNNYLIRWRVHPSELLEVLFNARFNGLKCICAVEPFSLYKFVKKWLKRQETKHIFTKHAKTPLFAASTVLCALNI